MSVNLSRRGFTNASLGLVRKQPNRCLGPMKDSQDREVSIVLKRDRHCFDSTAL
jgi:hypothetical protein